MLFASGKLWELGSDIGGTSPVYAPVLLLIVSVCKADCGRSRLTGDPDRVRPGGLMESIFTLKVYLEVKRSANLIHEHRSEMVLSDQISCSTIAKCRPV